MVKEEVVDHSSIHQPDSIASHVKKNIETNKDAYSIVYLKLLQFSYRIMHTINSTIATEVPHFIGEEGPYKDNSCCDELILEYTSPKDYFIEKKAELRKNLLTITDLSELLNKITQSNNTICVINDLGYSEPISSNIVLFSELVIYKAFIHYCKFNKDIPISEDLKAICLENNSEYNDDDSIQIKIKKMKLEGKLYTIESLYQLMQIVNMKNVIHLDYSFSEISKYHMLEESLLQLDETDDGNIPTEIRESLKSLIDTFDITIETKTKEMVMINRIIKTEWKKLEKKLLKIKKTLDKKEKGTVDKFLAIINKDHSDNMLSFLLYVKEFIISICKKYPTMILHKSDFQNIPILKHWKITSYNHKMDIISSIAKYYGPFTTFYDNEEIEQLLLLVLEKNDSILNFMMSLPYFSAYIDIDNIKHFHVLDEDMIVDIVLYLLLKSLTLYLDNIENVNTTHHGLSSSEDMRVVLARKKSIQESTHKLLIMYMNHFNEHYDKTEPKYTELKKRTLYAKEKEKSELVRYMSDMSDEQRNAEQALRATGQGRWATGQQKGYKEYRGTTYDDETKETRETQGQIDFTGEYMDTDDLVVQEEHDEDETVFNEEDEALNMEDIIGEEDDLDIE